MKIHNCSGCIGFYKNKLLFVKNTNKEIVLVKGHIEKNESPKKAAVREFIEETGYRDFQISNRKICTLIYYRNKRGGEDEKFVIRVYAAKLYSLAKEDKTAEDGIKLQNFWVDFSQAEVKITHKNIFPVIKKLKEFIAKQGAKTNGE